jgi:transcriptional antiterminator RfaH
MPLLPPEPFLFPEDLLSFYPEPAGGARRWWVLHTRPRAEKALARKFRSRGMSFFLPVHERVWRNGGRTFSSYLPLFPGYLFLHGDEQARLAALETNAVARILAVADQGELHEDLSAVHRLIRSGTPLTPQGQLEPGDWVEITSGALAGMEGQVLRRGKQLRFLVKVRFLQQGVFVELESWMIRPTNNRNRQGAEEPSARKCV